MMDCRRFEALLDDLSRGGLIGDQRRGCEAHAAECAACAELLALATLPLSEEGEDLVTAVMQATSGSPCDNHTERLAEWRVGTLSAEVSADLAEHVAACGECRGLLSVLGALERELPKLAELRPDARFVDDVLKRTLPVHVQLRRWWARTWPRWLHRPRFASEAAFIGLLALLLVFATPGSPLEAVPRQMLDVARRPAQGDLRLGAIVAAPFDGLRETAAASTEGTFEDLVAARKKTASKADEVVAGASESLATFWREAASLLGNDGNDAASETPDTPESNEETP